MALLGMFKKKKPKEAMSAPPTPEPGMKLEFPSPEDFGHHEEPKEEAPDIGLEAPAAPREADVAAPPLPKELDAEGEPEFPLPSVDTGALAEKETELDLSKVAPEKEEEIPMVEEEGSDILKPAEMRHMPPAEEEKEEKEEKEERSSFMEKLEAAGPIEGRELPKMIQPEEERPGVKEAPKKMQEPEVAVEEPEEVVEEPLEVEEPAEPVIEEKPRVAPRPVVKPTKPLPPMIEPHKEIPKVRRAAGTLFVTLSNFAAIVETGREITDDVHLTEDINFRISELNNTELEKLDKWIAGLETLEKNLQYIDNKLFSQGG